MEIHVSIDELHTVMGKGNIIEPLNEIVSLGRHKKVGWSVAQQNYSGNHLPTFIKNNAYKRHLLESKSPQRKRNLRKDAVVSDGDTRRVKRMLGLM